jgi:small subunit ribosomal protein S8
MMTDPIADMLTRIRNANRNSTKTVEMPASKMRVGIAEVLQSEGFVAGYRVEPGKRSSTLIVNLKYGVDGEQVIRAIDRVSKPGCRVYRGVAELKPVLRGQGIRVMSTPKGVISDRKARELNVGGEVLAEVY